MVVPGPVQNLTANGSNNGVLFSFCPPNTGGLATSYTYYISQGLLNTPAVFWIPPPEKPEGPFDVPYINLFLTPGDVCTIHLTPTNADGNGPTSTASVTPLNSSDAFTSEQAVTSTIIVTVDDTQVYALSASQFQATATAILDGSSSDAIASLDTTSVQAGSDDVTVAAGKINTSDPSIAALTSDAITKAEAGSTPLTAYSVGASTTSGGINDSELTFEVTVTAKPGVNITGAQLWSNTNGQATLISNMTVTSLGNDRTKFAGIIYGYSIYIITITTSSGTTVTVPVENNQAYNDYLHDQSGYQNRRENRLLTSGFYRGPVDSSTLTRIRAANGVLLGVPGVPGGMQGSRCCP